MSQSSDNQALVNWFSRAYGGYDLAGTIPNLARSILIAAKQGAPPVSLGAIGAVRGVKHTVYQAEIKSGARLDCRTDGFVIHLQKDAPWLARRAWWAHEIGHTLFFDVEKKPPRRRVGGYWKIEEEICELFAREILAPTDFLLPRISNEPSLHSLFKLARDFQVSFGFMAERILRDLERWKGLLLWCRNVSHLFPGAKSVNRPERKLRVIKTVGPKKKGFFIPLNKGVGDITVISEAFCKGRFHEGTLVVDRLGDVVGDIFIQAVPWKNRDGMVDGVIALIDLSGQRRLSNENCSRLPFDHEYKTGDQLEWSHSAW